MKIILNVLIASIVVSISSTGAMYLIAYVFPAMKPDEFYLEAIRMFLAFFFWLLLGFNLYARKRKR